MLSIFKSDGITHRQVHTVASFRFFRSNFVLTVAIAIFFIVPIGGLGSLNLQHLDLVILPVALVLFERETVPLSSRSREEYGISCHSRD